MWYSSHIMHDLEQQQHPILYQNIWPHVDQIFSAHGAVQKSFTMSSSISPSPFLTAVINVNLTDMFLIVDEYIECSYEYTICPLMTILSLCLKSCCLISNIIYIVAHFQPSLFSNFVFGGYYWRTPIHSNVYISLVISSNQRVLLFIMSIISASLVMLGTLIPNLSRKCIFLLR